MAIALYLIEIAAAIALVLGAVRAFGAAPTLRRLLGGLACSLVLGMVFVLLTTFLSKEGNGSRLPLIYWLGTWLLFACLPSARRALLLSVGLFVYCFIVSQQHAALALSPAYTDNPSARLLMIRRTRQSASVPDDQKPPPATTRTLPHTWLTGLHEVVPPSGGHVERPAAGEERRLEPLASSLKERKPPAVSDHAVIVHLRLSDAQFGSDADRDALYALEEQIEAAIEKAGAGEFDGNEVGQGEWVLYAYGPDADRLWQAVEPALRASPAARGGWAVKRYGEPGAREERVDLGGVH